MADIRFQDAVTASALDPNAEYGVYYMDGSFANEAAVRARLPHAKLFSITTRGAQGADIAIVDSEDGDLTIPETLAWVDGQVKLGAGLIIVYANADRWLNLGLLDALSGYGSRIKRWVANFDEDPVIPSWADAKQYATGAVDLNVARLGFFDVAPSPRPDPMHYERFDPKRRAIYGGRSERSMVQAYDADRRKMGPVHKPAKARLALYVLRLQCYRGAKRLDGLAHELKDGQPVGYGKFWRGWRRGQLWMRFLGERVVN